MNFKLLAQRFERYSTLKLIVILLAIKLSVFISLVAILSLFGGSLKFSEQPITLYLLWAKSILPAFLETLLFQYIILEYYSKFRLSINQAIWLSAVLFGLAHYQSLAYIIYEIPMGILYAVAYLEFKSRNVSPFLLIMGIHFFWNTVMLLT